MESSIREGTVNRNVPGRLSVAMPIYNGEKYIAEALNSVVSQDYDNMEVIVLDDGCTDNSILIAREILDKSGRLYNIYNTYGPSDYSPVTVAWPTYYGLYMSTGEYFTVHSDDDISPDTSKYSKLIRQLDGHFHISCKVLRLINGNIGKEWETGPGINDACRKTVECGDLGKYYSFGCQVPILDSYIYDKVFMIKARIIELSPCSEVMFILRTYAYEDYNYTDSTYMLHRIHSDSINSNPNRRLNGRRANGYDYRDLEYMGRYDYTPYVAIEDTLRLVRERLGIDDG